MAEPEFDTESLAVFLHTTPHAIERMASRGKLPGRRVGKSWKFSKSKIHEWFENRIGVSNESELVEVQSMLDRYDPGAPNDSALISHLLTVHQIIKPLNGRTKNSAIEKVCEQAGDLGLLWDPVKMAEAIKNREAMHPTALENGVALMHPRRPMPGIMADPFLMLGITNSGIPFGGPRGSLTDIFFLIASTEDSGHLRVLTRLSRLISAQDFVSNLRAASSASEIFSLITDSENELIN